jgi:hypothetical protein
MTANAATVANMISFYEDIVAGSATRVREAEEALSEKADLPRATVEELTDADLDELERAIRELRNARDNHASETSVLTAARNAAERLGLPV